VAELIIRVARREDAASLADALLEWGRQYTEVDPEAFQVPEADGLAASLEEQLVAKPDDNALWLVAERGKLLVGYIQAQIWRPFEGAERHIMRDASETILKVDALFVSARERRAGVGTALMDAAESWGKERGASRAVVISYPHSPTAVPFYEERMRYERMTIGFSKPL
jgi:GNAT superfamily N-acetyltransferase